MSLLTTKESYRKKVILRALLQLYVLIQNAAILALGRPADLRDACDEGAARRVGQVHEVARSNRAHPINVVSIWSPRRAGAAQVGRRRRVGVELARGVLWLRRRRERDAERPQVAGHRAASRWLTSHRSFEKLIKLRTRRLPAVLVVSQTLATIASAVATHP